MLCNDSSSRSGKSRQYDSCLEWSNRETNFLLLRLSNLESIWHDYCVNHREKHRIERRHCLYLSLPSFARYLSDNIQRWIPIMCEFCSQSLDILFCFTNFADHRRLYQIACFEQCHTEHLKDRKQLKIKTFRQNTNWNSEKICRYSL